MATEKKLNILYLDHTAQLSGGELALSRFLPFIDQDKYKITLLLGEEGPLADLVRSQGHDVTILPLAKGVSEVRKDTVGLRGVLGKVGPAVKTLSYSKEIRDCLRRLNVDVVHTNSLKSAFYGLFATKPGPRKLVWHIRDTIDTSYLPGPAVKVIRFLAKQFPDCVIANSKSTMESLQLPATCCQSVIASGGVWPSSEVVEWTLPKPPYRIALIGRIAHWKGQHVAIESIKILLEKGLDVELLIAGTSMFGEDEYFADLQKQVAKDGLGERVRFLGFVSDVDQFLKTIHLLIHTSVTPEPFGQVIIEGMAAGIPVIASAAGGPLDIVTPGENGLLVEPGNPQELANAVESLLQKPDFAKKIAEAGRAHALANYSAEKTAREVEKVYQSLF